MCFKSNCPKIGNTELFIEVFIHQKFKALRALLSRLLGRFEPIFYLNCEHVLFVYILKQRRKKFSGFLKKIKTFKTLFLKFLSFINLPWGSVRSQKKFGPDRFSRFEVYWIQTNKQKDKQTNRQTERQIYI